MTTERVWRESALLRLRPCGKAWRPGSPVEYQSWGGSGAAYACKPWPGGRQVERAALLLVGWMGVMGPETGPAIMGSLSGQRPLHALQESDPLADRARRAVYPWV